jgi:hypothetical protein
LPFRILPISTFPIPPQLIGAAHCALTVLPWRCPCLRLLGPPSSRSGFRTWVGGNSVPSRSFRTPSPMTLACRCFRPLVPRPTLSPHPPAGLLLPILHPLSSRGSALRADHPVVRPPRPERLPSSTPCPASPTGMLFPAIAMAVQATPLFPHPRAGTNRETAIHRTPDGLPLTRPRTTRDSFAAIW